WVGYYNHGSLESTDIVLDLGEERLISTLEIDSLNAADVGITYPKYVSFSYSMDNVQWSKPVRFDAPTSATPSEVHTFSYSLDAPEKARYVKVTHSIDWWTFFTEIRVMGEQIIEKDPNDIVRGMPYTTSLKDGDGDAGTGDFHREHPDVERTRLTDGAKAIRSDWRDSATVGFHTPTNPAVTDKRIDLTFDFGAVKNFEQIQFSTFKQDAAGILHPSAIVVEYKDAGGSWQKAFEGKMPAFDTVKGNFVFVVPDGQSLSAQAVRLTMTAAAGSSWIFMDEMEILERANGETANINPPVGTSAKPPVITKDLPSLKNTVVGETVTFDVAAKSADGGALSYQWYKNGETLEGKTTNQLILDKVSTADSGRYYVEITNDLNGQTTIKQSIITVLTVFDQQVEKPKNLIAGKTYTTSLTDQDFHASSPDVNRTKLTDGVFCDIWGTSEIVGYHFSNDMIDIAFNLDSPITFSEIQFGAVSAKGAGIFLPNYVKIEAKNGSTDHYKVIYEGESGSEESKKIYTYGTAIGEAITATNLRFTFKSKGSWLFMDEFEVFADATGKNLDGEIHMDAAAVNNNLLLGKPYVSVTEANSSYPDNNYELTDGNRGPLNVTNDRWSAYKDQFSEFIFDLGEETAFEEVKVGMSQDLGAGIQLPQYVNVYTSHDNTNWELISQNGIGVNATSQMLYDFRATMSQKKTARYVKVSIQPNGWLFLDEIEILKNYSTASEEQTNNLAYKKVYLSSPAASSAYPDTFAMTKLTDGKSAAANHTDSAWVGYGVSGKETEIVIDLGTITSFEQVEATFLDDVANGFSTPVAMQVDYSLDKKNWQEATPTAAVAPFSSIPTRSIIQSVVGADSARYVKVKFSAATNVMIDEIKVLKNRTMVGDGTVDPESVDPNNLAFRAAYETSWNADARYADNSKKELTDGACGSDYYNVSGWSGYQAQSETPFSVTVDLGAVKSFEQVQIGALESKTRSFPLSYPKNIKIEYSSDQSQWSVFANATVDQEGHGAKQFNYDSHAVSGRYVRFT
ncbi:MAG: discoidin domain-containing protein, partial [Oscillospiraceae bacterium]